MSFLGRRQSYMPEEYKDEMRAAAKKVNLDFDKDFKLTDNTCKPHKDDKDKVKRVSAFLPLYMRCLLSPTPKHV